MLCDMRIGVLILPQHGWSRLRDICQSVEECGVDAVWTYDHLSWQDLRDEAWYATVPMLTAIATVTNRVRIGTMVASPNIRHPVTFAKEIMTIDEISGGRFSVGVGAGTTGWDASTLGQPPLKPMQRAERFAEFVELTDRLLSQPDTSYRGRYYTANEARMIPGCPRRPPLIVAATGARGLDLAARYGQGWVTYGNAGGAAEGQLAQIREQIKRLDYACWSQGRELSGIRRYLLTGIKVAPALESTQAFVDFAGECAEVGVTDLIVHRPRPAEPFRGDPEAFDRMLAEAVSAVALL